MPPATPNNFNPQFSTPRRPANADVFNGRAIAAVDRQHEAVYQAIGNVHEATLPGHDDIPLYGQHFTIPVIGTTSMGIDWRIQANRRGRSAGPDAEYGQQRERLAVLRSRRRSLGSPGLNYGYSTDRGLGYGHDHNISRYESEYHDALADRIGRLVEANTVLNSNHALAIDASARAIQQEMIQMGSLERMAAERKSGNRVLNVLRNNKWLRAGVGAALSGVAVGSALLGILPVTAAALAARSAVSAVGGYELGRTGWDTVQGRRDRRRQHADPRMAGTRDGGISGVLTPQTTFERHVRVLGAEARAGSSRADRQEFIHEVAPDPVRRHLLHELTTRVIAATASPTGLAVPVAAPTTRELITNAVREVYQDVIDPLEQERLRSDQHQSRRRHRAGIVGAVVMGALPFGRLLGVGMDIADGAHASSGTHVSVTDSGFRKGSDTIARAGSGTSPTGPGTAVVPGDVNRLPNGSIVIDGNGNSVIVGVGTINEAAAHTPGVGAAEPVSAAHHLHDTFRGISTSELHVKAGGGFISTLQQQYNLSPAQADAAYQTMHAHLLHASGTYLQGNDIRISAPGTETLPSGAQTDLENYLKGLHRMSDHHLSTGSSTEHTAGVTTDSTAHNTSVTPAGGTSNASPDLKTGDTPVSSEPKLTGTATVTNPNVTGGLVYNNGLGNSLYIPGTPVDPGHIQALNNIFNVPETSINALSPEQATKAKAYLSEIVVHNGAAGLPTGDQKAAQAAIQKYIESSVNHPVTGPDAQQALSDLKQTWLDIGHSIHNLTAIQAVSLEDSLKTINAG